MKLKYLIAFIAIHATFLEGCKSKQGEKAEVVKKQIIGLDEKQKIISFRQIDLAENEQLLKDLDRYFDTIQEHYFSEVPKIFQLVLEPNEFESSFRITPIYFYSEFCYNVPSGYFQLEDKVILVYTGLEKFSSVDSVFFYKLNNLVNKKLVKDIDIHGNFNDTIVSSFWHPEAWQFKVLDKDSIIINEQVPAPSQIKDIPPPPPPPSNY